MIRTRKDNSIIGLSDFDELYRKLDELSAPKGKLLLLFDLSNNPQMDKNSRAFIYAEEMIQNTKALAFSSSAIVPAPTVVVGFPHLLSALSRSADMRTCLLLLAIARSMNKLPVMAAFL